MSTVINNQDSGIVVPDRTMFVAALPFILILILFLFTSNLFPTISKDVSSIKSSLVVYTGPNPETLTFEWISSLGVLIVIPTINQIYKTILTLFAVIAIVKVISYSGMIGPISSVIIFVAGSFCPYIAPILV